MTNKIVTSILLAFVIVVGMVSCATISRADTISLRTFNTVNLIGPVSDDSILHVKKELLRLDTFRGKRTYPLYLVIDSPGGSIYAGNQGIDTFLTIKNLHTITIFGASMASAIAQAIPGKRYITRSGIMMFHRASGGFQGQFNDGEVEQQLKLWKAIVTEMETTNADRLNISLHKYKELVKDEYWLTAKQSIKDNVADKVVKLKCSSKLIDKKVSVIEPTIFGNIVDEKSACPNAR